LCMLVIALTTAFSAWVMKYIVDDVFYEKQWSLVYWIGSAIIVAFLARGLATYGQSVLLAQVGNNIVARYQRRIFAHLMRLDMGFFTSTRSGQLAAQINQNVGRIRDLLNMTRSALVRDLVSLIGLVGVMIYQDPVLSLSALIIGPPLIYTVN